MARYSIELGNALRGRLFVRNDRQFIADGSPVTYEIKPGSEALAAQTWAVHGVCLACKRWSISMGRCAECAVTYHDPALRGLNAEWAVRDQIELAARA